MGMLVSYRPLHALIQIDKDVPLPPSLRAPTYPCRLMEVGDSFFIEGVKRRSVYALRHKFKARCPGTLWETRAVPGGYRIWRTK